MAMAGGGGGAVGAGDVRAGGAFVEISAKDSLTKTLAGLKKRVEGFAKGLTAAGKNVTLVGASVLAPLTAFLKQGVDRAEGIDRMAQSLGFSIEQMQKLQYAADVTGASLDDVMNNPERFQKQMDAAPVMDTKDIKAATEANQSFRAAVIEVQNALVPLAALFTPVIKAVGEFAANNKELIQGAFLGGAALTAIGVAFVAAGAAISGVITVGGAVVSVFSAIAAVVGVLSAPVWLTVAAVAALVAGAGAAVLMFTDVGAEIGGAFSDMFAAASAAVGGIVNLLKKGDLKGAMDLAVAGLTVGWRGLEAVCTDVWVGIKNVVVDTWQKAMLEVKKATLDLAAFLMRNDPTGSLNPDKFTDQQINASRDDLKDRATKDFEMDKASRADFRRMQVEKANQALKDAAGDYAQKLAAADAPAAPKAAAAKMPAMADAVRGAFRVVGGDGRQQFGTNQVEALKIQKDQLEKQEAMVAELKNLNANLRFG